MQKNSCKNFLYVVYLIGIVIKIIELENKMFNLAALLISKNLYIALSFICVALIVLCSLFVIIVVMMQKSNSDGISAITGSSDTFYSKNKSKTLDSKLKKLTVISLIIIGVLCVVYFILSILPIV